MTTIKILNNCFCNSSSFLSPLPPPPKWGLKQFPAHEQSVVSTLGWRDGTGEARAAGLPAAGRQFFSEPHDEAPRVASPESERHHAGARRVPLPGFRA